MTNDPGAIKQLTPAGRIGLVGAGAFGRFCLDSYQRTDDLRVVAVADPDERARSLVDLPEGRVVADSAALINDPGIDALHVATPPHLRAELVEAALSAGKAVFCEKPLAISLAEADRLLAAAERHGGALSVNYVMRHHPAYRLLEQLHNSGLTGALRTLAFDNFAQRVPPHHWFWDRQRSGGILVEHGVHFFDAYGRLAGEPVEVWGDRPHPEAIAVSVRYAGGAVGRYFHEFAYPGKVERTTGTCGFERATVVIEGWIPTALHGLVVGNRDDVARVVGGAAVTPLAGGTIRFSVPFPDRQAAYQTAIAAGMRDLLLHQRDPSHALTVRPEEARSSLQLALWGEAVARGEPIPAM